MESLSLAVFEILALKYWVTTYRFGDTWCHRSSDHLISHGPFPIGGPLEPSFYLWLLPRYSMANVTQWLRWP